MVLWEPNWYQKGLTERDAAPLTVTRFGGSHPGSGEYQSFRRLHTWRQV